jgi:hypothetical protein
MFFEYSLYLVSRTLAGTEQLLKWILLCVHAREERLQPIISVVDPGSCGFLTPGSRMGKY